MSLLLALLRQFSRAVATAGRQKREFYQWTFHISTTGNSLAGLGSIITTLIVLFYFTFLLGAHWQTAAWWVFKIKVVKDDGAKIGYVDALIRSLLLIIDAIPFIIPFLLLQFLYGRRKRDRELETVRHTPS